MKKIYHLSNCNTCQRIINTLTEKTLFELQDIKEKPISPDELAEMAKKVGSYEALFSRRARKYKLMGLKDKLLTESDFKKLILEEYTFLKRPVIIIDGQIFVGNASKTLEAALNTL